MGRTGGSDEGRQKPLETGGSDRREEEPSDKGFYE